MTTANETQIGGDHYKGKGACRECGASLETWDLAHIFEWDAFQFSIIKYVMRWKAKHGIEDLEKAQHFIAKLLELAREDEAKAKLVGTGIRHLPELPTNWPEIAPGLILELEDPTNLSAIKLVREFHRTYDQPFDMPLNIDDELLNRLRVELIAEELKELTDALAESDCVEVLDALIDLEYVIAGAYLSLGLDDVRDLALAEVQRSNMSKLGANGEVLYAESGKVLKGPNYSPPNLEPILRAAGRYAPKPE